MKAFLFKVTLATGVAFVCSGIGYNVDDALMDACEYLASTDYPEIDIEAVEQITINQ